MDDKMVYFFTKGVKGDSVDYTFKYGIYSDIHDISLISDKKMSHEFSSFEDLNLEDGTYIIAMPRSYFYPYITHDGGTNQFPFPVWKNNHFTSHLIYGVIKDGNIKRNMYYDPLYSKKGLLYDEEQLRYMYENKLYELIDFAHRREGVGYPELYFLDSIIGPLNKMKKYADNNFNISKVKTYIKKNLNKKDT